MFGKPINEINYKDINDLLYLKLEREGQHLDYKRDFHKETKEFIKDIVAFANAEGGYIIFGIDEKENIVCGINDSIGNTKIEDWIANTLNTSASESVKYEIKFIPTYDEEFQFVVVLHIWESANKPVYAIENQKSICYVRRGSSVFTAKPIEIKQMYEATAKTMQASTQVKQKSKGNNNIQIGINQGTVIKTDKVVKKNEVISNPETDITQEQAKQILEAVNRIVELNEKAGKFKTANEKGLCFSQTWTAFKNRFNITSYHLLPKEKFEDAIDWLKKQIAYEHRPKLRKSNNPEWRKELYTAIYAKARSDYGMDKEQLYWFVEEKLNLKSPIASLKDLSDVRLNKVYKLLFSN